MKKNLISTSIFLSGLILNAQNNLPFHWANKTGGSGIDGTVASVSDGLGTTFVIGRFEGTVDLDPGAGQSLFTSVGNRDIFIQKLNQNGGLIWAKTFGGSSNDNPSDVCIDLSKNIYITGTFEGTIDLNPNAGVSNRTSNGRTDVFVVKLDSSGFFYWGKSFGGSQVETSRGITVDNGRNVAIVGGFKDTVDFDPGAGVYNMTSTITDSTFNHNAYVVKLNPIGNFAWAKSILGSGSVSISAVEALWNSGEIYISGNFEKTADFDPNGGVLEFTSAGLHDAFLGKLTENGDLIWAKQFGAASYDEGRDLATDIYQNVYLIGTYSTYNTGDPFDSSSYNLLLDLDPNAGVQNVTGTASSNLFIVSLNKIGNYRWNYTLKATNPDHPKSAIGLNIETEICGNIYFTGAINGSTDAEPGSGVTTLLSPANKNAAVIGKLGLNGTFLGAVALGSSNSTIQAGHVSTDYYGNAYVSGNFTNEIDFDPYAPLFLLSSDTNSLGAKTQDGFFGKYGVHTWGNFVTTNPADSTSLNTDVVLVSNSEVKGFKLYPTPAVDVLNIQTQKQGLFEIYSMSGQLISSEILIEGTSQKNISTIPSGSYITRFISNNDVQTSRIVIGE